MLPEFPNPISGFKAESRDRELAPRSSYKYIYNNSSFEMPGWMLTERLYKINLYIFHSFSISQHWSDTLVSRLILQWF